MFKHEPGTSNPYVLPVSLSLTTTCPGREFFEQVFSETDATPFPGRAAAAGPHYAEINARLQQTDRQLKKLNPAYTPEYIFPSVYQSKQVANELLGGDPEIYAKVKFVKQDHMHGLGQLALDWHKNADAELPVFKLDAPPFAAQCEDNYMIQAAKSCSNACFRMLFAAATGHMPAEWTVINALTRTQGDYLVDDEVYMKAFATPTFQATYPARVNVTSMIGASLSTIAKIARAVPAKIPGAKVYATVNVQSETAAESNVWHTNVLLGARDEVVVADPSPVSRDPDRHIDHWSFVRRWAMALNRANVVIIQNAAA